MGNVEPSSGIQSRRVVLGNPTICLKFFKTALEFVTVPHARRRPNADATGIDSPTASWKWISTQSRDLPPDLNWRRGGDIFEICGAFSEVCYRAGECEYPLYVSRESAKEFPDLRNSAYLRCVGFNRWGLVPSPLPSNTDDPVLWVFGLLRPGTWTAPAVVGIAPPFLPYPTRSANSRWLTEPGCTFHRAMRWRPISPNGHFPYIPPLVLLAPRRTRHRRTVAIKQ